MDTPSNPNTKSHGNIIALNLISQPHGMFHMASKRQIFLDISERILKWEAEKQR
jgi:hypothetical protein